MESCWYLLFWGCSWQTISANESILVGPRNEEARKPDHLHKYMAWAWKYPGFHEVSWQCRKKPWSVGGDYVYL